MGRSFGQLLNRILSSVIFVGFGSIVVFSIWKEWHESPQRGFHDQEGTVMSHSVKLDMSRWKDADPAPLKLESEVVLAGNRRVSVADCFESADDAWSAASARPVESRQSFFASPDQTVFVWIRRPAFPVWPLLFVSAFVLVGISVWVPFRRIFSTEVALPVVVSVSFLSFGVFLMSMAVISITTGIRASSWPSVKYEEIGTQRLNSGKRGAEATAFRYAYADRNFETVVREKPSADGTCRVNPDKPWVTVLCINLGGSIVAILFALPFLAGGVCLPVMVYANRPDRKKTMNEQPWYRVLVSAFALIFGGSIVSVFVIFCGIAFQEGKGFAWFLAAFLLPFVYVIGKAAKGFVAEFRAWLRVR